jgi:orotidine-5'-phosphate decarboxylase
LEVEQRIIIALDYQTLSEVENFLSVFDLSQKHSPKILKVGMELYYSEGPKIIEYIKSLGLKIFLDLKVHDIPNTAYGAIKSLSKYGVDILNVHASGGIEMMKRAKEACSPDTKLIAVTQLTSLDDTMINLELGISDNSIDNVIRLAKNTFQAGLDGVVSSPLEAKLIKQDTRADFLTVCPGVRLPEDSNQDQKRISSPEWAFANGCDYIVMGRSITGSANPDKTFMDICKSLSAQGV